MRNFMLLMLFSTASISWSQQVIVKGPLLYASSFEVNFGEVNYGADLIKEFVFVNMGDENLIITNCGKSCGCTVPDCPQHPIKPGEKGTVKIKYDTKREGEFHKTITVTTNEVDRKDANGETIFKTYTVQVKGKVKPLLEK